MTAKPIPARMKGLNRAEICDQNFIEFVQEWNGAVEPKPARGRGHPGRKRAGCAVVRRAARIATGFAPPRPDGARAARAEQGLLHHRQFRPRRQRDGRAADPAHRSGFPALSLRRVHGRALPQVAGTWIRSWIRRCRSRPVPRIRLRADATRSGVPSRCGCCRRPRPSPRTCPRRSAPRWRSSRPSASAMPRRFPTTASPSVRSAMPPATMRPRRPRSTPRRGRRTRSCRRRCCSCARTTASAFR